MIRLGVKTFDMYFISSLHISISMTENVIMRLEHSGHILKEFTLLMDKTLLFKVEGKNDQSFIFDQSFKIKKKNCIDDNIIQKFNDGY